MAFAVTADRARQSAAWETVNRQGLPPSRRRPHASARCGRPYRGGTGRGRAWRTRRRDPVCGGAVGRGGRTCRIGTRFRLGPSFALGLEEIRREAANDEAPDHGLMLRGSLCWQAPPAVFAGSRNPGAAWFLRRGGYRPGVGGKMDSFFTVSRVALCICLLALAAAPEHTENKMDVFLGVVGSIFLLAVFDLAFRPWFSGGPAGNRRHSGVTPRERPCRAASWTPACLSPAGTSRPVRAPFEHGEPFAGAGRAPFLSPLKCSLHRRCKRHFRGVFHLVFPHDFATK